MTTPAELYSFVYAKEFPAQALLRLRPELREPPCAVLQGDPPLQVVCSMNWKARILGVAHGMTRVELDTFSGVATLQRSTVEEAAARSALLECAGSFSPRVEDRTSGDCFCCGIDIGGTKKLFGASDVLAKTLQSQMRAIGITASIAVSNNFHTARCLAQGIASQSGVAIVPLGEEKTALAPLPLSVLDLPAEHADTYALWGIRTLGMLAELPETELIARMGQAGKRHLLLARGELPHLFQAAEAPFLLEERMELDSPVEALESLLFVVGVMLEQLARRAVARALALAAVTVTLAIEGGRAHTRTVRPALPTNDRQLWIKLLHLDLEAHPPLAAILSLKLTAEPGSTSKVQLGLFSPQLPEPMWLDVTLARIRAIVGEENAGCAVLKDTHKPDEHTMRPFTITSSFSAKEASENKGSGAHRAALRQLRPAESTNVTMQQLRPWTFTFREKKYSVEQAYGPWLMGGDWWSVGRGGARCLGPGTMGLDWAFAGWRAVVLPHPKFFREPLACSGPL